MKRFLLCLIGIIGMILTGLCFQPDMDGSMFLATVFFLLGGITYILKCAMEFYQEEQEYRRWRRRTRSSLRKEHRLRQECMPISSFDDWELIKALLPDKYPSHEEVR